jgi:hypothetical protein
MLLLICLGQAKAWSSQSSGSPRATATTKPRRQFLGDMVQLAIVSSTSAAPLLWTVGRPAAAASTTSSVQESLLLIQQAQQQLAGVPALIKSEKWDSVRAVLITPPLADCWAKTSRPLLQSYAVAVGDAGGDELAALEAKEDAISHLRYLDMAVYNNIFNPIKTVGETGSTKALIQSYYEDPMNEWKASVAVFEELVRLAAE